MRSGRGANEGGTPLLQAAAASATSRAARGLEQLKACPQDERGGADRTGEGGERRIPMPGPAQLGEGNRAGESPLDAERNGRTQDERALRDLRLAAELQFARDRLERRSPASPHGGADPERHPQRDLCGQSEEIDASLRIPELPDDRSEERRVGKECRSR